MFPLGILWTFRSEDVLYYIYQDKLVNTKLVFLAPNEGFWMNRISL
jgi:hypothetical protein